jgi:hypothetical protein
MDGMNRELYTHINLEIMKKILIFFILLVTSQLSAQERSETMDSLSSDVIEIFKKDYPQLYNKFEHTDSFIVYYVKYLCKNYKENHAECHKESNLCIESINYHYRNKLTYVFIHTFDDIQETDLNRNSLCLGFENYKFEDDRNVDDEKISQNDMDIYNQCKLIKFLKLKQ